MIEVQTGENNFLTTVLQMTPKAAPQSSVIGLSTAVRSPLPYPGVAPGSHIKAQLQQQQQLKLEHICCLGLDATGSLTSASLCWPAVPSARVQKSCQCL